MRRKTGPGGRIVICCYCDARSILPPDGAGRLVCHGCGAPIRHVEMREPVHTAKARRSPDQARVKHAPPRPAEQPEAHGGHHDACRRKRKSSKRPKKRKSLFSALADDLFDLDDLFDVFD